MSVFLEAKFFMRKKHKCFFRIASLFWTDAPRSGWRGVSSLGFSASGCWTPEEKLLHINILECLAVLRCLLALSPPNQSSILISSDSTVVVSLINMQGSNKSKSLTKALHSLLLHCESHHWHLTEHHIPGHLNSWADSLSRDHPIRAEWELSPWFFRQLPNHVLLQIDLFAHPGNAKLPVFGCLFSNRLPLLELEPLESNLPLSPSPCSQPAFANWKPTQP